MTELEKEQARAARKSSLEHWTEKYRFYSHPPADKIGANYCDKFDRMKTLEMFERADFARKELPRAELRTRPTGAFKHLICQTSDPDSALQKKDELSFENTMLRVRSSLDISRQRTWHQNRPAWSKYNFYSGGSQGSSRYCTWMGQFKDNRSDPSTMWMETRLSELGRAGEKTLAAQESYHPFRTLEFPEGAAEVTNLGGVAKSASSPQI